MINLVGQKFGRLLVTIGPERRRTLRGESVLYWRCTCDCGKCVSVRGADLRYHKTLSCGCQKSEHAGKNRFKDLTGMRFGRLLVTSRAEDRRQGKGQNRIYWNCQCDCGNYTEAFSASLTAGRSRSCGCLRQEKLDNLTGKRFHRLVVIRRSQDYVSPKGEHEARWLCRCECGEEVVTSGRSLKTGDIKSCGCYTRDCQRERHIKNRMDRALCSVYRSYRDRARSKGLEWGLTKEQIDHLIHQPCFYCGAVDTNCVKSRYEEGNVFYNGIDRIDSALGYVIGNVVPCCRPCNLAKLDRSVSEFRQWILKVYHRLEAWNDNLGRSSSFSAKQPLSTNDEKRL